jgi:hypothetical protein
MHHQLERASVAKSYGREVTHVARCQSMSAPVSQMSAAALPAGTE